VKDWKINAELRGEMAMEDIHLNVEPNCSEETKEALKTALQIAAESLSNDLLSQEDCKVHAYYPYLLSDGKVHCKHCGHTITDKEWLELYIRGKVPGNGMR
jgi:hypothetical protein